MSRVPVNYGETVAKPEDPTYEGYDFLGWFEEGKDEPFDFATKIYDNVSLKAKWEHKPVTVTFKDDSKTETKTIKYGEKVTAPTTFTKEGHDLTWVDKDGKEYDFNTEVKENIELTAQWTPKTYTVTFVDGEKKVERPVTYNETVVAPTTFTKEGYDLSWVDKDGEPFDVANTPIKGDTTLTAKWTIKTYTVTFVDGEKKVEKKVDHGSQVQAPTSFVKEGYDLSWTYEDEEPFSFETPITEDLKLVAKWTAHPYTVSFNIQGHGAVVSPQTVNYGGKVTKVADLTADGFTFGGWYKDENCTYVWDFEKDTVAGDTILYAKWTINKYTVTFDSKGGSAVAAQKVEYNQAATEPAVAPTRDGFVFNGWTLDGKAYEFSTPVSKDITLKADWTKLFTVTFNVDGEVYDVVEKLEGETFDEEDFPEDPELPGYRFDGWFDEDGFELEAGDVILGDVKVYADLTKLFTVTFKVDGAVYEVIEVADGEFATVAQVPEDPEKDGASFDCWTLAGSKFELLTTAITADITLNAKFNTSVYHATFKKETLTAVSYNNEIVTPFTAPSLSVQNVTVTFDKDDVKLGCLQSEQKYYPYLYDNYVAVAAYFGQDNGKVAIPQTIQVEEPVKYTVDMVNGLVHFVFPLDLIEDRTFDVKFVWDETNALTYHIDATELALERFFVLDANGGKFNDLAGENWSVNADKDKLIVRGIYEGGEVKAADAPQFDTQIDFAGNVLVGWADEDGELVEFPIYVDESDYFTAVWASSLGKVTIAPLTDEGKITGIEAEDYTKLLSKDLKPGKNWGTKVDKDEEGNEIVNIDLSVDTFLYNSKKPEVTLNIALPEGLDVTKATVATGVGDPVGDADLSDGVQLVVDLSAKEASEFKVVYYNGTTELDTLTYVVNVPTTAKLVKAPALTATPDSSKGLELVGSTVDQAKSGTINVTVKGDIAGLSTDGTRYYDGADAIKVVKDSNLAKGLAAVKNDIDGTTGYATLAGVVTLIKGDDTTTITKSKIDYVINDLDVNIVDYSTVVYNAGSTVFTKENKTRSVKGTLDKAFTAASSMISGTVLTLPAGSVAGAPTAEDGETPAAVAFKAWSVKVGEAEAYEAQPGDTVTVTADTTITAIWAEEMTVSFNDGEEDHQGHFTNEDLTAFEAQKVGKGGYATLPAVTPTRAGRKFVCWSLKPQNTGLIAGELEAFDFSQPITGDVDLYAVWAQDELEVSKYNLLKSSSVIVKPDTSTVPKLEADEAQLGKDYAVTAGSAKGGELNEVDVDYTAIVAYKSYYNGGKNAGHFVGFSVVAPEGATKYSWGAYKSETGAVNSTKTDAVSGVTGVTTAKVLDLGVDPTLTKNGAAIGFDASTALPDTFYVRLTWDFDSEDESVYLFKVTLPVAGEDAFKVSVDHVLDEAGDIMYSADGQKLMTGASEHVKYAIMLKAGYVIEQAENDLFSKKDADGKVYAFRGYEVENTATTSAVIAPVDGKWTVDQALNLSYVWKEGVKVTFATGEVAKATTTAPATGSIKETMADVAAVVGDVYELPEPAYKPAGYTFAGWKINVATAMEDGTTVKANAVLDSGKKIIVPGTALTLTATWKQNLTVTLTANGGEGEDVELAALATDDFVLPENTYFTREHYTFNGWSSKDSDKKEIVTAKKDTDGKTVLYTYLPAANMTAPITVNALWKADSQTVTFDLNGGTLALGEDEKVIYKALQEGENTKAYDSKIVMPALAKTGTTPKPAELTKPGFVLAGFEITGVDGLVKPGETYIVKGDVTIKAKWISLLGTLDVVKVHDARNESSDPAKKAAAIADADVVNVETYDVGIAGTDEWNIDTWDSLKGETGEPDVNKTITVWINADKLRKHYIDGTNNGYYVGLEITAPEGIGAEMYKHDDGAAAKLVNGKAIISLDAAANQTRTFENFVWCDKNGNEIDSTYKVKYVVNLVGTAIPDKYSVKLNGDNYVVLASAADKNPAVVDAGKAIEPIVIKTKTGYEFDEEKVDAINEANAEAGIEAVLSEDNTVLTLSGTPVGTIAFADVTAATTANVTTKSITYNASVDGVTKKSIFKVTLDPNGGVGEPVEVTGEYNSKTKLPANTFTRTGYTFAGWKTKAGTSVADKADYTFGINNNVLYAQWTPIVKVAPVSTDEYKVLVTGEKNQAAIAAYADKTVFTPAEGSTTSYTMTVKDGGKDVVLPYLTGMTAFSSNTAEQSGHYVVGSYVLPDDVEVEGAKFQITPNETAVDLKKVLDSNGKEISFVIILKNGTKFESVFTWANGTQTTIVVNTASLKKGYTISYADADDTFQYVGAKPADVVVEAGDKTAKTAAATVATKTGYELTGWSLTKPDGDKLIKQPGEPIASKNGVTFDIVLTPVWTAKKYTVTVDYNGATTKPADAKDAYSIAYGSTPNTFNDTQVAKNGFALVGWVDDKGNEYAPGGQFKVEGDMTLTAKFVSLLGNLNVAPLHDARLDSSKEADRAAAVADDKLYKAGSYDLQQEVKDEWDKTTYPSIVNTKGAADGATTVPVIITAEDLAKHVVSAVGSPAYYVGFTVAAPAGLADAAGYKYAVSAAVGDSTPVNEGTTAKILLNAGTPDENGAIKYASASDYRSVNLQWVDKDGKALGGVISYQVYYDLTTVPANYTVTVTRNDEHNYVTDADDGWTNPSSTRNYEATVKVGESTKPLVFKLNFGYTADTVELDKLASKGLTYTLVPHDDGDVLTVVVTPSGRNATFPTIALPMPLPKEYTITFDANGGTGTMAPITGKYKTKINVDDNNTFTRENYHWVNWTITPVYKAGDPFYGGNSEAKEYTIEGNATLYADWLGDDVTVTVDNDNGDDLAPSTQAYGSEYTLPDTAPSKDGFIFKNWKIEGNAVTSGKPGDKITLSGDTIITAEYRDALATLKTAPLTDGAKDYPTGTAMVKQSTYKLFEPDTTDEYGNLVEGKEINGTTGKLAGNTVEVNLTADELVMHRNTSYQNNSDSRYWVGIEFTAPEGAVKYDFTRSDSAVTSLSGTPVALEGTSLKVYSSKLGNTFAASGVSKTTYIALKWFDADGNDLGGLINYKINITATEIPEKYKVQLGANGTTCSVTAGTVPQEDLDRFAAITDIVLTANANYYWDAEVLATTTTMPSTISYVISPDLKTVTISGTVDGVKATIDLGTFNATEMPAYPTPTAEEVEFVATGETTGTVTNKTAIPMSIWYHSTWVDLPANGTADLEAMTGGTGEVQVKKLADSSHQQSALLPIDVDTQTAPSVTSSNVKALNIVGMNKYVTGFTAGQKYEYKLGSNGAWTEFTANSKGVFEAPEAGSYTFRLPADGHKLASSATTDAVVIEPVSAPANTGTVTFKQGSVTIQVPFTDGVVDNISNYAGTWTEVNSGISVNITGTTKFAGSVTLVQE